MVEVKNDWKEVFLLFLGISFDILSSLLVAGQWAGEVGLLHWLEESACLLFWNPTNVSMLIAIDLKLAKLKEWNIPCSNFLTNAIEVKFMWHLISTI